ncbi:MAG: ABC transporter permease [Gammaproteobacteria bacterium]|nr:MAG: ABC transporter permease [Gammaproteobacteria bacterium]RTZ74705.1 MAG: ABC transporter permease [Gammaproteobacteria bacterium]
MIGTIAWRELRDLYSSASGWLALAAAQLLLAWMLFAQLEIYLKIQPRLTAIDSPLGIGDLVIAPTLASAALVLLLLVPLLGMGSLADELRSRRMTLLLSSPLSATSLVLGKWLGLLLACLPVVVLVMAMAVALGMGSHLDSGRLAAGALGLLLLIALASAVTLWFSSLGEQPLGAAALSWGLLFLLWFLDASGSEGLGLFSLKRHLEPFFLGMVPSESLVWFLTLTMAALALAIHRIWQLEGGD